MEPDTPSPEFRDDAVEAALSRLTEALALLDAIDEGDMLARLPAEPEAARRHQRAVSMLAVLRRELETVTGELSSAQFVAAAMTQISAHQRSR
jgi:hypothetical protein